VALRRTLSLASRLALLTSIVCLVSGGVCGTDAVELPFSGQNWATARSEAASTEGLAGSQVALPTAQGNVDGNAALHPPVNPNPETPPTLPPCVEAIRQAARACVEQTIQTAAACREQIGQLFQQGETQAALDAAQACVEQINLHTEECLAGIRQRCEECVEALMQNGAPLEQIQAVLGACRRAAESVMHARRGAAGSIHETVKRGLVHACIAHIQHVAMKCAVANRGIGTDCSQEVAELVAAGQLDEARARAEECIREIRAHTLSCLRIIQARCEECLARLLEGCGNEELIRLLREACERNLALVVGSARMAIQQILSQLPRP